MLQFKVNTSNVHKKPQFFFIPESGVNVDSIWEDDLEWLIFFTIQIESDMFFLNAVLNNDDGPGCTFSKFEIWDTPIIYQYE